SFGVFDEGTIATILRDVLRGLAYIHENGLVHRDLKCGNLLVKDDGIIQIADFGVAGFLASQPLTATDSVDLRRFTFVGTPCWMAPEVMQQARGYNQKADIWSLGITTIEMATGQAPYAKYAPMKVLMLTLQNDPPDIDTVATVSNQYADYGQKFRKFTRACLVKDPAQRLSARELLGHTYIKAKAKDRDLLCRVLLGGEMPPPVTRSNKHAEDRADKRDPKIKCTEWNFDTVGRGPQGAPDSDDSDEPDYGSGLALSDPDAGQHVPNQTVIAGSPSTDGTRAAAAAAAAAVSACGTSAFSGCGSLPPAPACTPVSPDGVVSGMVGAFADVMIDPNFAVGGIGQSANPEDGSTGPSYRITLRKRNPKQNNELQDISFNYVPGKDSADVLARELVEADLLDGCDLVLVAHNMSELISNPSARERVFPLNSPPAPGQVPVESELHGYAKVLIRVVGSPSI
ncbi:serine/threonine-protein kinase OSR1/STK39, partial [Paragonimus westermani]